MTTQEFLEQHGVSMKAAQEFVLNHLDHPDVIFNTAKEFDVNNDMLADIVKDQFPGVNGDSVYNFFHSHGFDAMELGFMDSDDYHKFSPDELIGKTLYHTSEDDGKAEKDSLKFKDDHSGVASEDGKETPFTYSINKDGILEIKIPDGSMHYIKAFEDTQIGGLQLKWLDTDESDTISYEALRKWDKKHLKDVDFLFDDAAKAEELASKIDDFISKHGHHISIDDIYENHDTNGWMGKDSVQLSGVQSEDQQDSHNGGGNHGSDGMAG